MSNEDTQQPKVNGAAELVELAKKALTPPEMPAIARETVEVAPPIVPAGQKIDEVDRLAIEITYLKMQNQQQRLLILEHQKNETVMAMKELQLEMETMRATLSKKYGVAIGPKSIDKHGNIVAAKS